MSASKNMGCGVALVIATLVAGWVAHYFWMEGAKEQHFVRDYAVPKKITYEDFVAAGPPQEGRYHITGCLLNLSNFSGDVSKIGGAEVAITEVDAPVTGLASPKIDSYHFMASTDDATVLDAAMRVSGRLMDKTPPENLIIAKDGSLLLKHDVEGIVIPHNVVAGSKMEIKDQLASNWVLVNERRKPSSTIVILNFSTSVILTIVLFCVWVSFIRGLFRKPAPNVVTNEAQANENNETPNVFSKFDIS